MADNSSAFSLLLISQVIKVMADTAIDTLIDAARLAPSGDNTQPWRFESTPATKSFKMMLVPERDVSPMNAANNMARIAFGAALENVYQTAQLNGWKITHISDTDSITVCALEDYPAGAIPKSIKDRATNRKKYRGTELPESQLEALRQAMGSEASQVVWITKPEDRKALCELIAQADSIILSAKPVRNAFLEKVRFDQPVLAVVNEGLSLGSLEVSAFERAGLRMMPYIPDLIIRKTGGPAMFYGAAHKLAFSASGFCIVTNSEESPTREFNAGRLFQRAWVALASEQLSAQPMMSLLVLQNMIHHLEQNQIPTINRERSLNLLNSFEQFLKKHSEAAASPVAMLRFGPAEAPSVRTARL